MSLEEVPPELRQYIEIVEEGGFKHYKCKWRSSRTGKECGALFFSLKDAIRHLVTHDPEKLRKYLRYLKTYADKHERETEVNT